MAAEWECDTGRFGPPDVEWRKKSSDTPPEGAIVCGEYDGKLVYAGRVVHEQELLIGAVIFPGDCIFSKDGKVQQASEYAVMSVPCGEPLAWVKVTADSPLPEDLVQAGILKNEDILNIGRTVINNNTLVGWVDKDKRLHVSDKGTEKIFTDFEILIHKYLKFLCICPPCPRRE